MKRKPKVFQMLPSILILTYLFQSTKAVPPSPFISNPTGPIDDTQCHIEQLEEANDSQLFSILHDLKYTAFFKSFAVDLDATCPITWDKQDTKKEKVGSTEYTTSTTSGGGMSTFDPFAMEPPEDDDGHCQGGLEDWEEAEPTCHVDFEEPETTSTPPQQEQEKEEFDCDGGSIAEEMEEDATPLCELTEEEKEQMTKYEESKTPLKDLFSSALNALNKKLGWESIEEKETFVWEHTTDPVVLSIDEEDCDDETVEGRLPDSFWLDMCAHIQEGDGLKMVDLSLNPERNTGYNGTHIWRAIYEENCIDLNGEQSQPMCYEERVMYRLLSGLHASTTLSIAKNYYPPNKRKGRETWTSNALYFQEKFGDSPEYIRNLHFSYVVLLRALKKAYPILSKYEIQTGNVVEDEKATVLLKRLLDSSILKSCSQVFSAFDESLMFRVPTNDLDMELKSKSKFPADQQVVTLQQNFKEVFHNISSILDCVQCQQCKLHGKMAMLGYGTALKILFMTNEEVITKSLSRNEIVAFINTIAKMSEALKDVRDLTNLYWSENTVSPSMIPSATEVETLAVENTVDAAIAAISTLANGGNITTAREAELVHLVLQGDEGILALAKYYGSDLNKFLLFSQDVGADMEPDAIVVGTGLAGLAASLRILDRGGRVVIIEKEHLLGGNSNKASSGINAYNYNNTFDDSLESFVADTTKSAGSGAQPELIATLASNSGDAVAWLKDRVGVDLSLVAQLGGHSYRRTHRPQNGMVGAEVIYGMQKEVKKYEKSGQVKIILDTKVRSLLTDENGRVNGVKVEYLHGNDGEPTELHAANVILATGGFASDRSNGSYLDQYRPELMKMPATAGPFSTGDGIGLAVAVGAGTIDMDKVQIHPTGWVDPKDPSNQNKILAAELMRGVGGVLINSQGQRFCNELGTRAYVTDQMLAHDPYYAENLVWDKSKEVPTFSLVLSSSAAESGKKHVDHYTHKGLLTRIEGIQALANWMGQDVETLRVTFKKYISDAEAGVDEWGKLSFQGKPSEDLVNEVFYAGTVTPVLHYCMGGITIDKEGNVLDANKNPIPGLHAAGEVTGGVHGNNRLGGNSLLECTVYGSIVGKKVPIKERLSTIPVSSVSQPGKDKNKPLQEISWETLQQHSSPDDCWVAIHDVVYDLTGFAPEHPAGAESIHELCGDDGTGAFASIHNKGMLDDFEEDKVGTFS